MGRRLFSRWTACSESIIGCIEKSTCSETGSMGMGRTVELKGAHNGSVGPKKKRNETKQTTVEPCLSKRHKNVVIATRQNFFGSYLSRMRERKNTTTTPAPYICICISPPPRQRHRPGILCHSSRLAAMSYLKGTTARAINHSPPSTEYCVQPSLSCWSCLVSSCAT